MNKILIIFWSGTGNTERMAELIAEGASGENIEISLKNVSETSLDDVKEASAIALGCPAMGDEVLEECEMDPFVDSISSIVSGKPCVLFGSYGWGDGQWMRDWYDRMDSYNANLITDEGLMVNGEPDDTAMEDCKQLGKTLKDSIK